MKQLPPLKTTVLAAIVGLMPLTASAAWRVNDGWCQSSSTDGSVILRLKASSLGFIDMQSNCGGKGSSILTGSNYIVAGVTYPSSYSCGDNTQWHGIQVTLDTKDIREIAKTLTQTSSIAMSTFGRQFSVDTSGFQETCGAIISINVKEYSSKVEMNKIMTQSGYAKGGDGQWHKKSEIKTDPTDKKMVDAGYSRGLDGLWHKKQPVYKPDANNISTEPAGSESAVLTPNIYTQALARAKSTWLISYPKGKADEQVWERIRQPDKTLNGEVVRVIRYTTTQPDTGVISDVDVEISPDGSVGYALSKDRVSPTPSVPSTPSTPVQVPSPSTVTTPINAFCTLDNGKHVSVYAADGQDYRYRYTDKNDKTELELKEGLFGVKAFHYYTQLGMGAARYIRFNKGVYDYVLLSKDTGHVEFYGVQVYKNGDLISSHECTTPLNLDTASLSSDSHLDSEKMGEYFTTH